MGRREVGEEEEGGLEAEASGEIVDYVIMGFLGEGSVEREEEAAN